LGALAVIWAPVSTLARAAEERRVLLGLGVVTFLAILGLIISVVDILGGVTTSQFTSWNIPDLPPSFYESANSILPVALLINAVVSPFVWWLVIALLLQLVTRFFGGVGPLSGMLAVVGIAYVPVIIVAVLQIPVTGLQAVLGPGSSGATIIGTLLGLLSFAATIWHAALVIIGAAFARRVGYDASAGSCAISCAGCVGLILILVVVFAVLVAFVVGAVSGGLPSS
jgi:Yip1 domain